MFLSVGVCPSACVCLSACLCPSACVCPSACLCPSVCQCQRGAGTFLKVIHHLNPSPHLPLTAVKANLYDHS